MGTKESGLERESSHYTPSNRVFNSDSDGSEGAERKPTGLPQTHSHFVATRYRFMDESQPSPDSGLDVEEAERVALFAELAFGVVIPDELENTVLPVGPPVFPQEILDLIIDFASFSYRTNKSSPTLLALLSTSPRLSPRCRFHLYNSVAISTPCTSTGINRKLYALVMRYNVGPCIKQVSVDVPNPSPRMCYWNTLSTLISLLPNMETVHMNFQMTGDCVAEEYCNVIASALGSNLVTTLRLTAGDFSCSGVLRILAAFPRVRRLVAKDVTVLSSAPVEPLQMPEFVDPDARTLSELEDLICTRCSGFLDTALFLRQSINGIPFRKLRRLGVIRQTHRHGFPPVTRELQELIVDLNSFSSTCAAVLSEVASVTLFVQDVCAIGRLRDCATLPRFNPQSQVKRRFAFLVSYAAYLFALEALAEVIRQCTGDLKCATVCITFLPWPVQLDGPREKPIGISENEFMELLTRGTYRHPVRTQTLSHWDDEMGILDFGDSLYY